MTLEPGELPAAIEAAAKRVRAHIRQTDALLSRSLSERTGAEVFLKPECLQVTGSFKARGALNRVLSLSRADLGRGVVTASTGNHGAAVAFAGEVAGAAVEVFVPHNASAGKIAAIERYGATVRRHGSDAVEAEVEARRVAESEGRTYVSPYNDPLVIAGQGTIGLELERQLGVPDALFAALGGGGLIGGLAGWFRGDGGSVPHLVGCSPERSMVMIESVRAGRVLDLPSGETISDGTAGGVEPGAITLPLVRDLVDELVPVAEERIEESLIDFVEAEHLLIEGSAAVPIAALLATGRRWRGKRVVVVLCGANIGTETLRGVLERRRRRHSA